ncbi:hypothetical protein JG687_00005312, partial [Phytophthora cactorum]
KGSLWLRFYIGDNFSAKLCIATKLGVPLIGRPNYQINLAINLFLEDYQNKIYTIQTLMIRLHQPNNDPALARVTPLNSIKSTTRWSSTFTTLERHVKIRDAILSLSAGEEHMSRAHRRIVNAVEKIRSWCDISIPAVKVGDLSSCAVSGEVSGRQRESTKGREKKEAT